MKKLLIVSANSVHLYNFIELVREEFDEILLVTDKINPDYSGKNVLVDFSISKLNSLFNTSKQIRKAVLKFEPSIIHIHQANSIAFYAFRALKGLKIPTVLSAWGSDVLLTPQRGFLLGRMVKKNLVTASAITSDSIFMAEEIKRLTDNRCAEILIANFGIDEIPYSFHSKEKMIYSNRLHENLYRIDYILDAFSIFISKPQNSDWRLVLAGKGSETEKLKELVGNLGIGKNVMFVGWVDKIRNRELYGRASIFVSIPTSDATSASLLEAMSSGCFPVVSNLPANREWIRQGKNGIIVENLKTDFFSDALLCDFEMAAVYNQKVISERASKSSSSKIFITLYRRLIGT
jgi:glycosyltransferase involved in cell wall biosynthesis